VTTSHARKAEGPLRPRQVWDTLPLPTAFLTPAVLDFRTGISDAALFPHTKWRRLVGRTLRTTAAARGTYADPAGDPDLRRAIARHIGISRGVIASADDVIVTSGTQQALDIVGRVLLAPSDRIAVEDPGYSVARRLFEAMGARITPVPVDREGLVVESIPRNVRAAYVTPSHQYPLGVCMTLPRRQALLEWARRNDAAVFEDDYDSEFRFEDRPLEPIRALDTLDRVIYIGSFSKTLLPALRLGFLIAPRSLRAALHRAKFLADWHSPSLLQAVLARFMNDGDFVAHLRRVSAVYRERHGIVRRRLLSDFADHLELVPSSTGLHVAALARTHSVERIDAIARRALSNGVAIQTLSIFAAGERAQPGIVLGYGGIPTADIERGLGILRKSFAAS
jgi:GntR family transcriptional regulator/MocR family aminotransferase